ncbi:hypothetical protein PHJA_000908700 [Phtheirospermum japonicum]|uniref:Uncharacterized protein n=1 Tax=Phtheirospermum japonicum TaxID=374723 RepID=A0A830BJ70_9LAMI|nr:hypothetical protein PHJA_000908700 [Phtheirospermum japonicum]
MGRSGPTPSHKARRFWLHPTRMERTVRFASQPCPQRLHPHTRNLSLQTLGDSETLGWCPPI